MNEDCIAEGTGLDNGYPRNIQLELTTRCNLHCRMCVKSASDSCIAEEDLPLPVFRRLLPALAHARKLILSGIGEPLLHPDLEEIIRLATAAMPPGAVIGFQTNGLLLDAGRALNLIEAGLSTVCLSLDSLTAADAAWKGEHSVLDVERATQHLQRARKERRAALRIGIETVITRENIGQLPDVIDWAVAREIDYLIATHLILYDRTSEALDVFNPNTAAAMNLVQEYGRKAAEQDASLHDCLAAYRTFAKTASDYRAMKLLAAMQSDADALGITLNVANLLARDQAEGQRIEAIISQAKQAAAAGGLELLLPNQLALASRSCPFIEEEAVFIAASGNIVPCHFLRHACSYRVLGEVVQVRPRVFGNLHRQSLEEVWRSEAYRSFRNEAGQYGYAPCWNCSQGPCSSLVNDRGDYANDCYGSQVPCGHCQWNLGGIRCL